MGEIMKDNELTLSELNLKNVISPDRSYNMD